MSYSVAPQFISSSPLLCQATFTSESLLCASSQHRIQLQNSTDEVMKTYVQYANSYCSICRLLYLSSMGNRVLLGVTDMAPRWNL